MLLLSSINLIRSLRIARKQKKKLPVPVGGDTLHVVLPFTVNACNNSVW